MTSVQKVIGSVGVVILALLMHIHYTDYGVAAKGHVFKLFESHSQEAEIIRLDAAYIQKILSVDPHVWRGYREGEIHDSDLEMYGLQVGIERPSRREIQRNSIYRIPIHFGLLPSPSAPSMREAFWLGVALPIALVVITVLLAARNLTPDAAVIRSHEAHSPSPRDDFNTDVERRSPSESPSLAELLLADFGPGFPIQSGDGSETDPLIITAIKDYVAVEYAIVRHVLGSAGEEFQLSKQALMTMGNRKIDKMIFDVKPVGAEEWQGSRSFYFDITAGYDGLFSS